MSDLSRRALRLRAAALLLVAVTVVTGGPAIAYDGGGSLNPYRLEGELMVGGGSESAGRIQGWMDLCPDTHAAIERYLDAEPWANPPEGTEADAFESFDHLNVTWGQVDMVNLWSDAVGDGGWLDPVVADSCSRLHEDGWMAVSSGVVNAIEGDGDFVDFEWDGEYECEFGELLIGSASYGYRWQTGEWVRGLGTGFRDVGDNFDGSVITDLYLTCVQIFDEVDVANVAEATPASQANVNPDIKGLTQLDHWLWYDFTDPDSYLVGPLTTSVDALGFTWVLETSAWVDQVWWCPVSRFVSQANVGPGLKEYRWRDPRQDRWRTRSGSCWPSCAVS